MSTDHTAWSRRRVLGLGAGFGVAAVLGGCTNLSRGSATDNSRDPNESDWGGTLLEPPFDKPDVTFTDVDGNDFPFREATAGRLSVLFFGFINCPDICPVYLNTLASARAAIGSGAGSRPQVLFVGVDTARDTPEAMKEYLGAIDPTFIGLTAEDATIAEAIASLRMASVVLGEPAADGSYDVGHPSQITAFTADDVAHRIYPSDVRQQQWVKDLPRLDQGQYQ
ncbi:SCO family protein [soil metagenome]